MGEEGSALIRDVVERHSGAVWAAVRAAWADAGRIEKRTEGGGEFAEGDAIDGIVNPARVVGVALDVDQTGLVQCAEVM